MIQINLHDFFFFIIFKIQEKCQSAVLLNAKGEPRSGGGGGGGGGGEAAAKKPASQPKPVSRPNTAKQITVSILLQLILLF